MAGRSQHRDNRSSYFSSDIGRSGVYDGVNGTPINFSQKGDNPNDLRDTEGISETARESGLYASRIGSTKQPTEDYSKEGMLGSTGNFPRQNWDQSFEEGNRTPESGTYSRNIESNQYDTDYKANNDIGRSSTFDNNRDSGLYSRKIGSFRETIPENSGKDNQRQSSKHFKPNKYIGNTLDTMLEGEDESKQPEHFHSTNYSESRKYSGTARNGDYDGHSNASFQDDKEFPPWAGMMVEQQFTDKYIKTKWPRISLHLTQPRHSDPFVPGKIDEGSIDINSAKDDHKTRNTLCVIGLGTLLLCLVGAAIITVIVLANQSADKTEYVKVNMTVTVDQTFISELNDPKSTEYKTFATEVCKQTKDVYTSANSTLSGYYGCKVSNLENGSIIVTYIIYFTGTTTQQVTPEAVKTILNIHLNVSSSQLGYLVIETGSVTVNNVETETLSSPPPVEESVTTTTTAITTPHIDTTTEVVKPSTVTTSDSETVQTTEATTLNTKQTTMETTNLTTSSTETTTPKTVQTTTETVISTVPPTEDTTTEPKQATMVTTTSKVPLTEDTTTETVESTTEPTSPLISSTEETTPKTVQAIGETSTPSVSLTDETTPKAMHSTKKIITASSSSTENTTPKTMQTETTSPIIDSTVESMSSQSTNHVSEVTTTLQTDKATEATQETTSSKKTPTKEPISSTTKEEPTTLTSTITTSSTEALSDTTTSDSTERTKTSSSLPFIDTTKPVISTSTDDTNQLITSPTTEDTTKLNTSTPPDETTRLITSTSTEDTTSKMPSTSTDYTTHAEDTTKLTTSASTEESTTQLITPTSIDDTTKPVTFTSTDDTTATLTSTATVDTTKSVTSTPIEDVTQSVTFTSTEKTTKHVTSTPSEDTTKTISSAPTEDTTPSITAISTEDTPTEDTTTKTVSSIITEGTTLSITSMPTTERTTLDEITTVSGTTTERQNIGLNCTDSLTEVLYSGPVAIVCTIQKSYEFDYIRISHDEGSNNSIYGILLNKDGTTIQNFVENQDINVTINSISTINLVLTFVNVSCAMEGFYKVAIISNMSGEMKESVSRKIQLEVSSPAEKPILTLNADQVIDLIFNNNTNDYFRAEGLHQCEGYVGRPPTNLEITITHDNGTSFQTISQENIYLNISKMSDGCRNKELIKFGLRFTPGMVGSKLRCGVKDSTNDFTLSEELSLIPRNICSCAVSESYRAHPSNCKVKVFCIEDGGIMYPTGISCPSNECRNSITGKCTTNCSNAVCEETVPSDFCTTPAPPTTTPAPSPYITCTGVSFSINSAAAVMTCSLNDTATFSMMNVTYKKKGDSEAQHIAVIDDSNNVIMLAMQDHVNISIFDNIISITILNPSCENEGTFGIVTTINSETVEAQGQFSLQYPPGNATLQLNADQVIDLGFYRVDRLHSCTGVIGNPPQELILEILYANTTGYQELSGPILEDLKRNKTTTSCRTFESITFGLRFSSEMTGAKIRCRPAGNINNDTLAEDSLFLIPRDICECGSLVNDRGHPGRCNVKIVCLAANNLMYPLGVACADGQCRNSITGICTSDCSASVCNEEVPAEFCITTDIPTTTPIPPTPSVDVSCNGSSIEVNMGPVDIVCYFNQTIYDYINISFTMRNDKISRPVADIQAGGTVAMIDKSSNRVISISVNVITIRTKNASCDFGGTYRVTVDTGGTPGFSDGILEILTKPGKPSIDKKTHTINGNTVKHTCTGNVGNPPGSIEFLIRKNGEENFTVSPIAVEPSQVTPNDNCNNEQSYYHEQIITSDWNMTTIKCRTINQRTVAENDDINLYISDETDVILIAADTCPTQDVEYKPHPRGCGYYVECANGIVYGRECGTTCFNFNPAQPACDFCDKAPPPCNDTNLP